MRVIAGSARRLPLKTTEGMETRPTTDRIKETLFNMLQYEIAGRYFLDLFSGSGAIGIEALSRGAGAAYFVESHKKAAACIRENLAFTKLEQGAAVMECDCLTALGRLEDKGILFDVVCMDPPYGTGQEKEVLAYLSHSKIISEETVLVAEVSLETDLSYAEGLGFCIDKEKRYKTNKHIFLHRNKQQKRENR